jgi:hypothetical protein
MTAFSPAAGLEKPQAAMSVWVGSEGRGPGHLMHVMFVQIVKVWIPHRQKWVKPWRKKTLNRRNVVGAAQQTKRGLRRRVTGAQFSQDRHYSQSGLVPRGVRAANRR